MSALAGYLTLEGSGTVVFPFLSMTGSLQPVRPDFDRVIYKGVNGIGIWSNGSRGEPFSITTEADYATAANAETAIVNYIATISGKRDLYRNGILKGTVLIHNVIEVKTKQLGRTIGGNVVTNGAASVILTAQWTMEFLAP